MRLRPLLILASALAVSTAAAQEAYLDDRSTPRTLVRSLYNAIERGEYARAFSYFAEPPAETLQAYAQGFEGMASVELLAGEPLEEGAAGSVYIQQPVVVRSTAEDGAQAVYAGCYTLQMANPAIETDEFQPLMIESGGLEETDADFAEGALPDRCGEDGRDLPETDMLLDQARDVFDATFSERCYLPREEEADAASPPDAYSIDFRYMHETADDPMRSARLFRFPCNRGAYNETHVYLMSTDEGGVEPVYFAAPELDIRYVDDDLEQGLDSMTQIGMITRPELVNSDYDPDTQTITTFEKWRGVGDASASGRWIFRYGAFTLVQYEVDATYDGEINPETVLDLEAMP